MMKAENYAMHRKLNVVILAFAAGLVGGLVQSSIAPVAVFAQGQKAAPKEIQAQNFVLVNSQGNPMGSLDLTLKVSRSSNSWTSVERQSGLQKCL